MMKNKKVLAILSRSISIVFLTACLAVSIAAAWYVTNTKVSADGILAATSDAEDIDIDGYALYNTNYPNAVISSNVTNYYTKEGDTYSQASSFNAEGIYYQLVNSKYKRAYTLEQTRIFVYENKQGYMRAYDYDSSETYYEYTDGSFSETSDSLSNTTDYETNVYFYKDSIRKFTGLLLGESLYYSVSLKAESTGSKNVNISFRSISGGSALYETISVSDYEKLEDTTGYIAQTDSDGNITSYIKYYTHGDNEYFNMCDLYTIGTYSINGTLSNPFTATPIRTGSYTSVVDNFSAMTDYAWNSSEGNILTVMFQIRFTLDTTDAVKAATFASNSYSRRSITFGSVIVTS